MVNVTKFGKVQEGEYLCKALYHLITYDLIEVCVGVYQNVEWNRIFSFPIIMWQ